MGEKLNLSNNTNQIEEITLGELRNLPNESRSKIEVLDPENKQWVSYDKSSYAKRNYGFSRPSNPFAYINAITVYKQWLDEYVCIAVIPEGQSFKPFEINVSQYGFNEIKCRLILVDTESELLGLFLDELEDVDFISGWNSEFYDLPYIYKRIYEVLGEKQTARLNFPGVSWIREKTVTRFGKEELVIQLQGRAHLDYQDMFKKFTFEGRESFRLDAIAHEELGFKKLEYDGTLEKLYLEDFIKFVHYNIIDVVLIKLLDDKFRFVQLVNQMAHENTVTFEAILGTTKYVDSGISNFAINNLGVRVKDKDVVSSHGKVEGAIVLTPNVGLHEWIGSVDINSLYPSVIRSLNLSPEKVIGQFKTDETIERLMQNPKIIDIVKASAKKGNDAHDFIKAMSHEEDWRGIMINEDHYPHTLMIYGSHEGITMSGAEWKQTLIENRWAISAYGTVLDQSQGHGILPQTLSFWFSERKRLQAEKKKWIKILKSLDGKDSKHDEAEKQEAHYELLQLTKKIQLNSAYGALLAKGFRWGVEELIGASTTYSGRAITSHMCSVAAEVLTGKKIELEKSYKVNPKGEIQNVYHSPVPEIIYSDTDSAYFMTMASNKEEAIEIADGVADIINESFQQFMKDAFNCQPEFDCLIKAGREVVAERGLFQARKKYMLKVIDLDGFAVNKMKAMGSEIKKSDTPKVIQKFLKEVVDRILGGKDYQELTTYINQQRRTLFNAHLDAEDKLLMGIAKATNNLEKFTEAYEAELAGKPMLASNGKSKLTIPGHCRAAINYNKIAEHFDGLDAVFISSGDKVKVYNLKPNEFEFETIAIPAESSQFPEWMEEHFEIDFKLTEEKLIDNKLEGIFSAWGHEVPTQFLAHVSKVLKF